MWFAEREAYDETGIMGLFETMVFFTIVVYIATGAVLGVVFHGFDVIQVKTRQGYIGYTIFSLFFWPALYAYAFAMVLKDFAELYIKGYKVLPDNHFLTRKKTT